MYLWPLSGVRVSEWSLVHKKVDWCCYQVVKVFLQYAVLTMTERQTMQCAMHSTTLHLLSCYATVHQDYLTRVKVIFWSLTSSKYQQDVHDPASPTAHNYNSLVSIHNSKLRLRTLNQSSPSKPTRLFNIDMNHFPPSSRKLQSQQHTLNKRANSLRRLVTQRQQLCHLTKRFTTHSPSVFTCSNYSSYTYNSMSNWLIQRVELLVVSSIRWWQARDGNVTFQLFSSCRWLQNSQTSFVHRAIIDTFEELQTTVELVVPPQAHSTGWYNVHYRCF